MAMIRVHPDGHEQAARIAMSDGAYYADEDARDLLIERALVHVMVEGNYHTFAPGDGDKEVVGNLIAQSQVTYTLPAYHDATKWMED